MRRLPLLSLFVLWSIGPLVPAAHGAAYAPATPASITWTPNVNGGVGVPGGIPARSTIYTTLTSTGDSTDRTNDIKVALAACPEGQTVLLGAGTFYISPIYFSQNGTWSGYWEKGPIGNRTLRGSGSSYATGTVLRITGSQGINISGGVYSNPPITAGTITGSPTKGATTLSVTNVGGISVGKLVRISTANDDTLPSLEVNGYDSVRSQLVYVTAVNSGANTFTFQPALYQTPAKHVGGAALSMGWAIYDGGATLTGVGIEDMCIDNTHGTAGKLLNFYGGWGCWFKNIRFKGITNYGIHILDTSQSELRDSYIEETRDSNWVTSNHAGVLLSDVSALLIENNVILKHFPLIETQNGSTSGCVFGYNFGLQYTNNVSFTTHNGGNHCNLWEGNCATNISHDGYFGSSADDVIYRNDLHGVVPGSGVPHYPVALFRFARRWEIVGNQLGRSGTSLNYKLGGKTAFNFTTVGTANNLTGDPHVDTLLTGTATRIADNSYTVLMDTTVGHLGLEANHWPVMMRWPASSPTNYRQWLAVTNIASLTVSLGDNGINNSSGDVATTGTVVRLWPGANGFQEDDLAVDYSTVKLGNYQFKDGTIDVALGTTTLPDSLYRASSPSWFSGYTWPPYSPTSPVTSYSRIPAGARYEAEANTVSAPSFSPAAGAYASAQNVTITSATSGATIHYTTDGSTPTTMSATYSSPLSIAVSPSTTLKAFAVKSGMTDSSVTSGVYSLAAGGPTTTATATNTTVTGTLALP